MKRSIVCGTAVALSAGLFAEPVDWSEGVVEAGAGTQVVLSGELSANTTLQAALFTGVNPIWKTGPGKWYYGDGSYANQFLGIPVVVEGGFTITVR